MVLITQDIDLLLANAEPKIDPETSKWHVTQSVSAVERSDNWTRIHLADGTALHLQPYIYVREGNVIEAFYNGSDLSAVWKQINFAPKECPLRVRIYPSYSRTEVVHVPPHVLRVTIRERTSA
ncbi:unnamed protein product, partial [marine sediment metagenome]